MKCPHCLLPCIALLIAQYIAAPTSAAVEILNNTAILRGEVGTIGSGCSDVFVDEGPRPLGTFTSLNYASVADCIASPDGISLSLEITDEFTTRIDSTGIDVVHKGLYVADAPPGTVASFLKYDHMFSVSFAVKDSPVQVKLSGTETSNQGLNFFYAQIRNPDTGEVIVEQPSSLSEASALLEVGNYDYAFEASMFFGDVGMETLMPSETSHVRFVEPIPEPATIVIWSLLGVLSGVIYPKVRRERGRRTASIEGTGVRKTGQI